MAKQRIRKANNTTSKRVKRVLPLKKISIQTKRNTKTRKISNHMISFPRALIFIGIVLIGLGLFTHTQLFFKYRMLQREKPVVNMSLQAPAALSIPSIGINVNVDEGGIVNGEWVLANENALYLPTSGKLGEGFNTIIYAHNTPKLFGKLASIKKGNEIIMRDKSGKHYKYKVFEVENVDPKDLKKLYSTQKNIITLFTCSGWADTSRTVVRAKLMMGI